MSSNEAVPASQAGRIRWVAKRLYPDGRWRARIASALGIGRSTLYRWLKKRTQPAPSKLDDELMMLVARERIASQRRARDLAETERTFAQQIGRSISSKKGEGR